MNKYARIVLYGLFMWIVPFIVSFFFVDATGNFTVPEKFFKSIMVVTGALVGVYLSVRYFGYVKAEFVREGVLTGVIWFAISFGIDLIFVYTGFFGMTFTEYVTEVGIRYLAIPIYTIGLGYVLKRKCPKC